MSFNSLPPLSLYIHIPWCIRKCPYCDFNSYPITTQIPEKEYIDALVTDLEQDLAKVEGRVLNSIFIGGGTPNLFSPRHIAVLLQNVQQRIAVKSAAEITIEANPGGNNDFASLRSAGITRISLGVQSFQDEALSNLQRIHTAQEALTTIERLSPYFENFNLDLMFGLPHQTVVTALDDLRTALAFHPPHLSWYQLTIEPDTPFYHTRPLLPDDEMLWNIYTEGKNYLTAQHYINYEISGYSLPHYQCQHNLNYWNFGDYLGIGAGAHSKITNLANHTITRWSKQCHPSRYLQSVYKGTATVEPIILVYKGTATVEPIILEAKTIVLEFMMNALRLTEGFTVEQFNERTGLAVDDIVEPLNKAYRHGWLIQEGHHIYPTEIGRQFLNDLLELFM